MNYNQNICNQQHHHIIQPPENLNPKQGLILHPHAQSLLDWTFLGGYH